jgi:hypothetical protein
MGLRRHFKHLFTISRAMMNVGVWNAGCGGTVAKN